ncbi:MAG: 2-phospho-L-lactate guanylyltransferase [Streptosporangiaceae bacterium]
MGTDAPLTWSVVIPVKLLALAKSRLSGLADLDRRAMALAMAADTVTAAITCQTVGHVIVVSDDPDVRTETAAVGATVIADRPGAGLNEALTAGADHAAASWSGRGLAALTADLPALSAAELAVALAEASAVRQAFVADAAGSGTTLYTAVPGTPFLPRFGPRSRERHRKAGVVELEIPGIPGLRRDVDTLSDLCDAARIGLGARTLSVRESINVACT